MDLSETGIGPRRLRAGCLALLGAVAPLAAGADVIALFDEVADLTVTPPGITYPAVTPEEMRTVYANDMAAVHIAMYDVVVAIRGGYQPFATKPASTTPVSCSVRRNACGAPIPAKARSRRPRRLASGTSFMAPASQASVGT